MGKVQKPSGITIKGDLGFYKFEINVQLVSKNELENK